MAEKAAAFGAETMRNIEKQILLQTIDAKWREHLLTLEHLRSVVGFRGYAQRDPLNEYKTESFQLFESMLDGLRDDVTQKLAQIRPMTAGRTAGDDAADAAQQRRRSRRRPAARRPPQRRRPVQPLRLPRLRRSRTRLRRGRSRHLGQSGPQRCLPLRIGQEVQALPRPAGLKKAKFRT